MRIVVTGRTPLHARLAWDDGFVEHCRGLALDYAVLPHRGDWERAQLAAAADELRAAGTAVLVVNGAQDPFGIPDSADASRVVVLPGETHALSKQPESIKNTVESWLREVLDLDGD